MIKKKLISIRVEESLIDQFDEISKRSSFYSRSNLIEASMRLLVVADTKGMLDKVRYFCPRLSDKCDVFNFEYHREKK